MAIINKLLCLFICLFILLLHLTLLTLLSSITLSHRQAAEKHHFLTPDTPVLDQMELPSRLLQDSSSTGWTSSQLASRPPSGGGTASCNLDPVSMEMTCSTDLNVHLHRVRATTSQSITSEITKVYTCKQKSFSNTCTYNSHAGWIQTHKKLIPHNRFSHQLKCT